MRMTAPANRATKLVWPAGSDAEMVIGVREGVDYPKLETAMRELMQLDW